MGMGGEAIELPSDQLGLLGTVEVGQQHLAAGGGVQRGQLTDPVLADHRCLPLRLDDIDGEVLAQHRHVDRLAERAGQLIGQRSGLLGQFELDVDAASESYEPEAQAVLSPLGVLLDHLARLERTQQAKRRGLVHTDLAGELADPAGAPTRQQFEYVQGAVHRLETAAGVGVRYGHGVPSRILAGDASHCWRSAGERFGPLTGDIPLRATYAIRAVRKLPSPLPASMSHATALRRAQRFARGATYCEGLITLFPRRKTIRGRRGTSGGSSLRRSRRGGGITIGAAGRGCGCRVRR